MNKVIEDANDERMIQSPFGYSHYKDGRIFKHKLKAEKALGKPFNSKHPIHHHKEKNNTIILIICENIQYHNFLHQRTRALKACGHATWRQCCYCKVHDNLKNLTIPHSNQAYHKPCAAEYQRKSVKRRI